jgi:hypothetical protein
VQCVHTASRLIKDNRGLHYTRSAMPDDPFAMLGLPRSFDLERSEIRRAYLERVTPLQGGGDEGRIAELNRARAALEDHEQRANVLLEALGGPGREQDRTLPDGFLERMLEVNERVEAAVSGTDQPEIHRLLDEAEARREGHIRRVGELFAGLAGPARGGEPGRAEATLREVRRELNAWRYIERLIERLERAEGSELL